MSLISHSEMDVLPSRQDDSRKQLGAFLRARRESLDPQRLGLPRSGRQADAVAGICLRNCGDIDSGGDCHRPAAVGGLTPDKPVFMPEKGANWPLSLFC